MNKVTLIDPLKDPRWDQFVLNHPHGCIGHTSAWKQVLENSFSHMKGYYYVIENQETKKIIAALPIFRVRSWITGNRLVSIPFATISDPLINDQKELTSLINSIVKLAESERCKKIEAISFMANNYFNVLHSVDRTDYVTHQLHITKSLDNIFKKFHPSVRYSIKRSERSGFKLQEGNSSKNLSQFYTLYSATRKRLGLPVQPYIFFKNMMDFLAPGNKIAIHLTTKDSKPISAAIFTKYKGIISLEYAGWDRAYQKECPNHFLYWQTIKDAKLTGFNTFDFGRTSLTNNQLMQFKSRWGTSRKDLHQHIFLKNQNEKLGEKESSINYRLVTKICQSLPEWGFKRFSSFCYRHLG